MAGRISEVNPADSARRVSRVSKKKRRTEISSSEESSSSSSSDEENDSERRMHPQEQQPKEKNEDLREETEVDVEDADIDGLEVPKNGNSNTSNSRDVLETRLKLGEVHAQFSEGGDLAVPAEEWVASLVGQYGEEINQLRQSADFKDGSIAQVAQLLRETRHVISKSGTSS